MNIDLKVIEEETMKEARSLIHMDPEEAAAFQQTRLFKQMVEANVKEAEVKAAKEERNKDLYETEKSLHEKIRMAAVGDAENIKTLIEGMKIIKELEDRE